MKTLKFSALVLIGCSMAVAALAQGAEDNLISFGKRTPTVDEIAKALGGGPDAQAPEATRTRGIALGGSTAATRAGAKLKAMDMDVQFGFGSDALSPRAKSQLIPVGQFLKTAKLDSNVVVIEGHTDSLGSVDFANDLSLRRAQTVKDFLVAEYKLDPSNFVVLGRGKQLPKDRTNMASEANRRIQFYIRPKE